MNTNATNKFELFSAQEKSELLRDRTGTPIWEHWDRFVEVWQKSGKSEYTIKNVRDTIRLTAKDGWFVMLEDWQNIDAAFDMMHRLRERRWWSFTTFNSYRKHINTYFLQLVERGILTASPTKKIKSAHGQQRLYPIPTMNEFNSIMEYLKTRPCTNRLERARNVLFFEMLAQTGARPLELIRMKFENVQNRDVLRIDGVKTGGRPRHYPVSESLRNLISAYMAEAAAAGRFEEMTNHFFLGVKGGGWSYSGIRKLLSRMNKETGLSIKVTCYAFRRNAATLLFRERVPLEQISKFLGHWRASTTLMYIQGFAETNSKAADALVKALGR